MVCNIRRPGRVRSLLVGACGNTKLLPAAERARIGRQETENLRARLRAAIKASRDVRQQIREAKRVARELPGLERSHSQA